MGMARLRRVTLFAFALLAPACGGGAFGSRALHATLTSAGALDGSVRGDFVAEPDALVACGDVDGLAPGVSIRGFYSFNLSAIPEDAIVTRAILHVFQVRVDGSPYPHLGHVLVDHVAYGPLLDGSAYGGGALDLDVGTLSTSATLEEKTLDVTDQVGLDVQAHRTRSQYRLRFSALDTDDDGNSDAARFTDAENTGGFGTPPFLEVTYHR
jgi:hypothetical protein